MKKRNKMKLNIKKIISNNMVIIDFISKIIFGLCSIVVAISANKIANEQLIIDKDKAAPLFYITEEDNNIYKLENKGGVIKLISFDKIDHYYVSIGSIDISIEMTYLENENMNKMNKKNIWYYQSVKNNISTAKFRKQAEKDIKEHYPNINSYVSMTNSYFRITYHDYNNEYKTDYYSIHYDGEIVYDKYRTETTPKSKVYMGMLITDKPEADIYNNFIKSIFQNVDLYYQ